MKYWLFDGKDAQGPFEPDDLKRQPGFTPESLICPDGADSADQWRPAQHYLIKPPPAKAEAKPAARSTPELSRSMGRIAEAGLIDEPVLAEPGPKAAPRQEPRPGRSGLGGVTAAVFAATCVAAAYWWSGRPFPTLPWTARPIVPAPAPTPAPAPKPSPPASAKPATPPVPTASLEETEAFVKSFPVQSAGRKGPLDVFELFSPRRWRAPKTIGESLRARELAALTLAASSVLDKQGKGVRDGERQIQGSPVRWKAFTERFLRAVEPLRWEGQPSNACGSAPTGSSGTPSCLAIAAILRLERGGPEERHAFAVDLTARTLRPLDSGAWQDVDPKAARAWAAGHVRLTEPVDDAEIVKQGLLYGLPLSPRRAARARKPPQPPPRRKAAPRAAPAPAPKPAQAAKAQDEAADEALVKSLTGEGANAAKPQPAASKPVPPGLEQPIEKAPTPSSDASSANGAGAGKSAMDMSVDELQQYLKRESQ